MLTNNCCLNHWFYNNSKQKVAVAAKRRCGRPSHCSHRHLIFFNAPFSHHSIFFMKLEPRGRKHFLYPLICQNPISASTVWGIIGKWRGSGMGWGTRRIDTRKNRDGCLDQAAKMMRTPEHQILKIRTKTQNFEQS